MVHLPIFERLDVDGYGLYPGDGQRAGAHIHFTPGLTLIVGANGLGKTTLVTIIYRLLTGTHDIAGLNSRPELGTRRLEASPLQPAARRLFAGRVTDRAEGATARLTFALGAHRIVVERRLGDLTLARFIFDDRAFDACEEGDFQRAIARAAGVWSFGDWIVLLRYLVFYFEDRRALVWDDTAQRQILRILLLPVEMAQRWSEDERAILTLNSRVRNLNDTVTRESQLLERAEDALVGAQEVRDELRNLEPLQVTDTERREALERDLAEDDVRRGTARGRFLRAQQERESRYRALERAKLIAIDAHFPRTSDTARYILAQILADAECLVCGNRVPAVAADLEARIAGGRCVVCASDVARAGPEPSSDALIQQRVEHAALELTVVEPELAAARGELDAAEAAFAATLRDVRALSETTTRRAARIAFLIGQLPDEEAQMHQQAAEFAVTRGRLAAMRQELSERREAFNTFVTTQNYTIAERSSAILGAFERYASGFLTESCRLLWSPQPGMLGQTGIQIEFPFFELELGGAGFASPVRRSGPEQVSESQREFIDLSFRMALIGVATTGEVGSIVIDAPESSLDAVFARRAAEVLARFAEPGRGNRLVLTSNLVEGELLPDLLRRTTAAGGDNGPQLVNLFQIAAPTAAVRALREEYDRIYRRMAASADGDATGGGDERGGRFGPPR